MLSANGLARSLSAPAGIDLSSNDYLGLAEDASVKTAFVESVSTLGVGSTGSRLLRGERTVFADVERTFARWKGSESSLYFATGYQANIGIFQTFLQKQDAVFSDELNHASIIDGIRLGRARKIVYPHLDLDSLEAGLASDESFGEKFVVTESLFSMDGDIAPLSRIADICRRHGANLIVDEAHAVGLYGKDGSGLIEENGIEKDVFLSVNTAGKALGVSGAFVAGEAEVIRYLINRCRSFIYSTAPVPAAAAAIKRAIEYVKAKPESRGMHRDICIRFADLMREEGIEISTASTHIVPVLIGESAKAVQIAEELQLIGFDVRAIRPPTVPDGTARLRVSLNTKLTDDDLSGFVHSLATVLRKENR